jgi:hypothetical protein
MKLVHNGKEYEVDVTVNTDAHKGVTVDAKVKTEGKPLVYSGPFNVEVIKAMLDTLEK